MGLLSPTKRRIVQALASHSLHGYLLAKQLDLTVGGIYPHLRDLQADGFIEGTREGRRVLYTLTKKGRALLDLMGR